jgi:hypothetical protein
MRRERSVGHDRGLSFRGPARTLSVVMGCAIGCLALAFPRIALACVWLFAPVGYLSQPFPSVIWPVVGFVFLPTTTLAFAYSSHSLEAGGSLTPFGWVLVIVGLCLDLGLLGGGGRASRWRRRRDEE